jgi:uncharacterized protein with ParB-like and HNH nuclease domain
MTMADIQRPFVWDKAKVSDLFGAIGEVCLRGAAAQYAAHRARLEGRALLGLRGA